MAQESDPPIHYLRIPRAIALQMTSIACMGSGVLASIALEKITTTQDDVTAMGAELDSKSVTALGGVMIAAGAFAGMACALILIPLTIPSRAIERFAVLKSMHAYATRETRRSVVVKEAMFAICAVILLAAFVPSTVIVASQSATITGVSPQRASEIASQLGLSLEYKKLGSLVACIICGWVAFLGLLLCLFLVSRVSRKVLRYTLLSPNLSLQPSTTRVATNSSPSLSGHKAL